MDASQRAEMYVDFLEEEGYRAEIDDDGDVFFRHEGGTYIITVEEDEEFFRLIFANFWSLDDLPEKAQAVRVAHDVTRAVKAAKVFRVKDNMWCTVEAFHDPPENFKSVLLRSIRAIQAAVARFAEEMRKD
ncbi:hypothetical protein [Alienimonas sp. DA493]|uniref:hypothetical protein n=1 Tax=Alienimonas sp. DA493 TaxID=3373605 RepID=UPI0037548FF9